MPFPSGFLPDALDPSSLFSLYYCVCVTYSKKQQCGGPGSPLHGCNWMRPLTHMLPHEEGYCTSRVGCIFVYCKHIHEHMWEWLSQRCMSVSCLIIKQIQLLYLYKELSQSTETRLRNGANRTSIFFLRSSKDEAAPDFSLITLIKQSANQSTGSKLLCLKRGDVKLHWRGF